MAKRKVARKKVVKKNIARGIVHIAASFNNTLVTVTDDMGNMIAWSSAGSLGFKGSRSEEHTSELQSPDHLFCRLLLEKRNSSTIVRFYLSRVITNNLIKY